MAHKSYSADQARGGEIVFRERWERIVFFGGLACTILLMVIADIIWG